MMAKRYQNQEVGLYETIVEVRRLFHRLARAADDLHADTGITASQRAVLEALAVEGPASVSAIARQKRVTRQHIQVLVNRLLDAGLIEPVDNPAHQRSPLLRLTGAGRRSFDSIQAREKTLIRALAKDLGERDFGNVARALCDIGNSLDERSKP